MKLLSGGACALMSLFCPGGGGPGGHEIMPFLTYFSVLFSDFSPGPGL